MRKDIPRKGTVMEMQPLPRTPVSGGLVAPAARSEVGRQPSAEPLQSGLTRVYARPGAAYFQWPVEVGDTGPANSSHPGPTLASPLAPDLLVGFAKLSFRFPAP